MAFLQHCTVAKLWEVVIFQEEKRFPISAGLLFNKKSLHKYADFGMDK